MSGPLSRRCCNPACPDDAPAGWECDRCDKPLCRPCDAKGGGLCARCVAQSAAVMGSRPEHAS